MVNVLIVDDEVPFLRNLACYLRSFGDEFGVTTAVSGEEALALLGSGERVDVLLTDIRLPGIDGLQVVRRAVNLNPQLRVLVMTAYPSREIRRDASKAGALLYLEKPLDLKELRTVILDVVRDQAGWSGLVGGLDIFDFTQLFILSGKTTAIRVSYEDEEGILAFRDGLLVHASTGTLEGEEAFFHMTGWHGGSFDELPRSRRSSHETNISCPSNTLMIEAARRRDEAGRGQAAKRAGRQGSGGDAEPRPTTTTDRRKENEDMAVKDHLAEFEDVEGFRGIAVFTAQGEMLESIAKGKLDIKTVGMFANNALLNAQKATDQMGVGRGNMVQIRAPEAMVLMRCLNEATDFAATQEGKAHFHTVVVMDPEGNAGMASMLLDRAVGKIAEELR